MMATGRIVLGIRVIADTVGKFLTSVGLAIAIH